MNLAEIPLGSVNLEHMGQSAGSNPHELRALWKEAIKHLTYNEQIVWLGTKGIEAFGAAQARAMAKSAAGQQEAALNKVCSASWADAVIHPKTQYPPSPASPGSAMVLGRGRVRIGASRATLRYTPPQCVSVEDMLDTMSYIDAIVYDHPASPSARAIQQIEMLKAREKRKQLKTKQPRMGRQCAAQKM